MIGEVRRVEEEKFEDLRIFVCVCDVHGWCGGQWSVVSGFQVCSRRYRRGADKA